MFSLCPYFRRKEVHHLCTVVLCCQDLPITTQSHKSSRTRVSSLKSSRHSSVVSNSCAVPLLQIDQKLNACVPVISVHKVTLVEKRYNQKDDHQFTGRKVTQISRQNSMDFIHWMIFAGLNFETITITTTALDIAIKLAAQITCKWSVTGWM